MHCMYMCIYYIYIYITIHYRCTLTVYTLYIYSYTLTIYLYPYKLYRTEQDVTEEEFNRISYIDEEMYKQEQNNLEFEEFVGSQK